MASRHNAFPLPEYRAFEVFRHLPVGHAVFFTADDRNAPHLKQGEFAVVDMADVTFVSGELYLVRYTPCPPHRTFATYTVWQLSEREFRSTGGVMKLGIFFHPLNRPRSAADAERRLNNGTCHISDGPLSPEHLPKYIAGRVVGVLASDVSVPMISADLEAPL